LSIRVLLADDERLVRAGFRMILSDEPGIEVVGEAADGAEGVRLAAALRPQAVLLDLQMPVMDGFQAATQMKAACPRCRVVALTIHDDPEVRRRAAEAGADAFVVKGAPIALIVEALMGAF
jgi:DNA-binding NarL/FixJ family response regulator